MNATRRPWHYEMTRYHWFVLLVAALGWLFDTMDQQLFVLARVPAMEELLAPAPGVKPAKTEIDKKGPYTTSFFLMGWATGGLGFGILGDKIGRAKTMLITILLYSLCTGLSAFSRGFWDFAIYRFITGLGIGGEFAVGVSLVAEVMPESARARALGLLQALSAVGNISAALINNAMPALEDSGIAGGYRLLGVTITAWRLMFLIGTLPALLAILIRRRLKEPDRWKAMKASQGQKMALGSYGEMFGNPEWRRRALLGMALTASGVIGLWGIGFFVPDLNRAIFTPVFQQAERDAGEATADETFVRLALSSPQSLSTLRPIVAPEMLLMTTPGHNEVQYLLGALLDLKLTARPADWTAVLEAAEKRAASAKSLATRDERQARYAAVLEGIPEATSSLDEHAQRIADREKRVRRKLTIWSGYTSIMLNLGAFCGIYAFSIITQRIGRRPAFAFAFSAAMFVTAFVFWYMDDVSDIFWMVPIMGFCQLSLFGGFAIYLPELFPTRLRSTGTSFCYNVGRFVAAIGPFTFGYLNSHVFNHMPREPMRYSGVCMCAIFLFGLAVLPFIPETRDEPLPE